MSIYLLSLQFRLSSIVERSGFSFLSGLGFQFLYICMLLAKQVVCQKEPAVQGQHL